MFQPVFDIRSGRPFGFEALARDASDPVDAFPTAIAAELRRQGEHAAFNLACARIAIDAFFGGDLPGRLFVNIDPSALTAEVVTALDEHVASLADPGAWRRIVVEVTESSRSDPSTLSDALAQLRSVGAAIALDDFGEGFASLRLWSEVRPQIVKIDRHFCQGIDRDPYKREFVRSLRRLSARLGIVTIAEGVETDAELDVLSELDIRLVQGWRLGRPAAKPARQLDPSARRTVDPDASRGRIVELCRTVASIDPDTPSESVYAMFESDRSLQAIPIVRDDLPVGLVERPRLTEFFARRFGRELFGQRPIMTVVDRQPLVVEDDCHVVDAARLLAEKDEGVLDHGLIVTSGGRFAGVVQGRELMRALAEHQLRAARHANPLTMLPGNLPIADAIDDRLEAGDGFAMACFDIDHFKPFNDTYGYGAGDDVIRTLGASLCESADPERDFVGHVGGDDFLVLFRSVDWLARIEQVRAGFAAAATGYFGEEERRFGSFPGHDREGIPRRFPLLALSVGVIVVPARSRADRPSLLRLEADAKRRAKRGAGLWIGQLPEPGAPPPNPPPTGPAAGAAAPADATPPPSPPRPPVIASSANRPAPLSGG